MIEFKCSVVPKIIDYGRSFFDNGNTNSKKIYHKMCAAAECKSCGVNNGFGWIDPVPYYGISSQQKNESHDLRLLVTIIPKFYKLIRSGYPLPRENGFLEVNKLLRRIVYGEGIVDPSKKSYGTTEDLTPYTVGGRIRNVTDAFEYLQNAILNPDIARENETKFSNPRDKLGDFHIYEDGRDMEYIPL